MRYDDGSELIEDGAGGTYALNSAGNMVSTYDSNTGVYVATPAAYGNFATDAREAAKLDQFVVRPNGDNRPWWERVAEYGLTRAIDNQYGPVAPNKTGTAGTFAGQNGKTYVNPNDRARGGAGAPAGDGNWLLLLLAAGVAFLALA